MYTVNDKKINPREAQIKKPKDAEELSLLLTTECYIYLKSKEEKFETYAHIMSALVPNPLAAYDYDKPKNPEQLRKKIKHILEVYISRNRKNQYREIDTIGSLVMTKNEFIERMIQPFLKDQQIKNGDIFPKSREMDEVCDKITGNSSAIDSLTEENNQLKQKVDDLTKRMNNFMTVHNERKF